MALATKRDKRMAEGEIAAAGSRREARERVLGLMYQVDVLGVSIPEIVASLPLPLDGYAAEMLDGIGAQLPELDAAIGNASLHWSVKRMPRLDLAVLRMGLWELWYQSDIPDGVALSEAVELAAEYSTEDSSKFVNGVLSKLAETEPS